MKWSLPSRSIESETRGRQARKTGSARFTLSSRAGRKRNGPGRHPWPVRFYGAGACSPGAGSAGAPGAGVSGCGSGSAFGVAGSVAAGGAAGAIASDGAGDGAAGAGAAGAMASAGGYGAVVAAGAGVAAFSGIGV